MDSLVRYLNHKLRESLSIVKSGTVEKLLSSEKVQPLLVDFCKPTGISTLTFYYQRPEGDDEGPPHIC